MISALAYEVVEDRDTLGMWRVEAINYDGDGEVFIAIFSGPEAHERAEEYARWKRAGVSGVPPVATAPTPEERARLERCPSCDDHLGYGREWSVWLGGIRIVHGIYRTEAQVIVDALVARDDKIAKLQDCEDEPCGGCIACLRHYCDQLGAAYVRQKQAVAEERRARQGEA